MKTRVTILGVFFLINIFIGCTKESDSLDEQMIIEESIETNNRSAVSDPEIDYFELNNVIAENLVSNGYNELNMTVRRLFFADNYTDISPRFLSKDKYDPYSVDVMINGVSHTIHAQPTTDYDAYAVLVNNVTGDTAEYDFSIAVDREDDTQGLITYNGSININPYGTRGCVENAAIYAAVGRTISFGTFFGCGPCAFVGGAMQVLAAVGAAICVNQ